MPVSGHGVLNVDENTTEQNMTTVEDGYNTADDGGPAHKWVNGATQQSRCRAHSTLSTVLAQCVLRRKKKNGHNTADDGETHNEHRREIRMQHSKLINLHKAEHILQICDSSGHEEQPIFSRNILTNCAQEHLRRNLDFAFWLMVVRTWIWLMVVRTRKTDDDN